MPKLIIEPKNTKPVFENALSLELCLAKTIGKYVDEAQPGIDVFTHCLIVGLCARELVARLSTSLLNNSLCSTMFPTGLDLLVASHDVGKINPHFQKKIWNNIKNTDFAELKNADGSLEKQFGYHAGASQSTLSEKGERIARVVGAHHGIPQNTRNILGAEHPTLGGTAWKEQRQRLLRKLESELGNTWPEISSDEQERVLTGLTIVSDWIGSSSHFEYRHRQILPREIIQQKIERVFSSEGFGEITLESGKRFQEIFAGYNPRQVQANFVEQVDGPGVYILEEQMGQGKTEAALMAAYRMIEKKQARGIYFALPTRLTSEKMYERMKDFLEKILPADEGHRTRLIHSKDWLFEEKLGEDARPGYSWFNPRKRALLAPVAVGTIDQALMAVMNVKHSTVRAYGLFGKVVILDEVHSYDSYTGTLLDELIATLYKLGCIVIVLTATLQVQRKREIFSKCLEDGSGTVPSQLSNNYPLISALSHKSGFKESDSYEREQKTKMVTVHPEIDENPALEEAIDRAEKGQYVLWIENTVANAQKVYKTLASRASELSIEAGLLHSRFTPDHRKNIEDTWVSKLGKNQNRDTKGCILVGTQVLEQSLDIDADFLVTRIAPSDMLLQRIGRLWRHEANNQHRAHASKPEVYILSPPFEEILQKPEEAFGSTASVYSPYILFRTAELWKDFKSIVLPRNMREIIENTYSERIEESDAITRLLKVQEKEMEKLQRLARIGIAEVGRTLDDNEFVPTRYSEQETVELLLLKSYRQGEGQTQITFLDGHKETLANKAPTDEKKQKEQCECTKLLYSNILSVPKKQAPECYSRSMLKGLANYLYLGNDKKSLLAIGIVAESDSITGLQGEVLNERYELWYTKEKGFEAAKV